MTWYPAANRQALRARAEMYERIRHFFARRKVLEVETPQLGLASTTDPHVQAIAADNGYLQASAAHYMMRLMAAGSGDIYQISKVFRRQPDPARGHVEASLLEWFRSDFDQWDMMEELADLLEKLLACPHFDYISYRMVFEQYLGLDPLSADIDQLRFEARQHLNVEIPRATRDDWLDLLMAYFIEPGLGAQSPVFVYDYPSSQAGMASLGHDETGAEIAEAFRLYYRGRVIASGYKVLTDSQCLQLRFSGDNELRRYKGLPVVPVDGDLLQAFDYGMPACAVASVNLDELLMQQLQADQLGQVISFVRPR